MGLTHAAFCLVPANTLTIVPGTNADQAGAVHGTAGRVDLAAQARQTLAAQAAKKKVANNEAKQVANFFENHFQDYAEALKSGDEDKKGRLVAKASIDGSKTAAYDPVKYTGTFVSTSGKISRVWC